jgi:hypothetical protein
MGCASDMHVVIIISCEKRSCEEVTPWHASEIGEDHMLRLIAFRGLSGLAGLLLIGGMVAGAAAVAAADPVAVERAGPGGGELVPDTPEGAVKELENSFEIGPKSAAPGGEAVFASGCIAPFRAIRYRIALPRGGRFLHRVVPDRRGFNVVMTLNYPGLFRRVNRFGPGRVEAFTVGTPSSAVRGTVTISGVGGSFGCYVLGITP